MLTLGEVLRRWREAVCGISQTEAARLLHLSRVHVSRMEDGTRSINRALWPDIDEAFGASGALAGLFGAVATPGICEPRGKWSHNFDVTPKPVWMWLRVPDDDAVHASISWGPVHLNIEHPAVAHGVIVTSPTSVPNPPAEVTSSGPCWVDFGVGVVPQGLGLVVIDGARAVAARSWDCEVDAMTRRFYPGALREVLSLTRRFGLSDWQVVPHLASILPEESPALRLACAPGPVEPVRMMEPLALRRIREARGWSSPALAEAITTRRKRTEGTGANPASRIPESAQAESCGAESAPAGSSPAGRANPASASLTLTRDDIDAAESGRTSRVPFLLSRLDIELALDGRSCLEVVTEIQRRDGQFTVTFPAFWVGPIWLVFTSPDPIAQRVGTATLTWAPWRRRLDVVHGTVVTTRRSAEDCAPLLVDVPSGWVVRGGVGLPADAHDVGEGWRPAGPGAMLTLLTSSLAAMRKQFDDGETSAT